MRNNYHHHHYLVFSPCSEPLATKQRTRKIGCMKLAVPGNIRCNGFTTRPSAITVFTKLYCRLIEKSCTDNLSLLSQLVKLPACSVVEVHRSHSWFTALEKQMSATTSEPQIKQLVFKLLCNASEPQSSQPTLWNMFSRRGLPAPSYHWLPVGYK